jgi:hypothetical protein
MFMQLNGAWAIDGMKSRKDDAASMTSVTPTTIAFKLFIAWLYFDAGYGKYTDPLQGWTLDARPLPALDTYVRHTVVARYVYGWLGPRGLRYMTPTVVYVELLGVPSAFLTGFFTRRSNWARTALYCTIGLMCSMHVGIALTMNNTMILSLVACVAWCIFLPEGVGDDIRGLLLSLSLSSSSSSSSSSSFPSRGGGGPDCEASAGGFPLIVKRHVISMLVISSFVSGSVWFETMSAQCNQSMEHIWSTLLHNRWNVFVGAEE